MPHTILLTEPAIEALEAERRPGESLSKTFLRLVREVKAARKQRQTGKRA